MFIYNVKVNRSLLFKIFFFFVILFVIILCLSIFYNIYNSKVIVNDDLKYNDLNVLTNKNYATVLETVHNNIDEYVGQKIKYSGFVYRVYDLNQEQFILGRNMLINSNFQTVVVGFLCHCKDASNFSDGIWVELEGTITKGQYHGDMPILEITYIHCIDKPSDEFVYPPDENYIPTSAIL